MLRDLVKLVSLLGLALGILGCETVPLTGRSQLIIVSEAEEQKMGLATFRQALETQPVSNDPQVNALVRRVGSRIAEATGRTDFDWEFRVIRSDEKNAWCAPGGKVVVYTGILDVTGDEAGLAVVIGHEVAHAIARHGAERLSQTQLSSLGVAAAAIAAGAYTNDSSVAGPTAALLGMGMQYGILLPYSREHESEADHLGLIYMAKAGYDPHAAAPFWRRMSQDKQGGGPPEFLSTHPADETRIRNIEGWLPEAMSYYRKR